jgi:mannose-6-phosphate isomerase-like protein (cupin superfamily)
VEADYTVRRVEEMERAFSGVLIRVRAELGVTSFGLGIIELPPDSGDMYPEHDHSHNGQEEVYILLEGSAHLVLPGETVALDREVYVRVGATTRRRVRSGPTGARLLVMGASPNQVYEPQANSELGAPDTVSEAVGASSSMFKDSPPPRLS